MSDLRAAAQQALEALEHDGLLKKRQAITALRAALPCTYKCEAWPECACAALAQQGQEQEPVAIPSPPKLTYTGGWWAITGARLIVETRHPVGYTTHRELANDERKKWADWFKTLKEFQ